MIDITTILSQKDLEELNSAITNGENYTYSDQGLTINVSENDNISNITFIYEKPKTEKQEFLDYVKEIDDDLFIETCEGIEPYRLQQLLDSDDPEIIKAVISDFKKALNLVVEQKINYYSQWLNN